MKEVKEIPWVAFFLHRGTCEEALVFFMSIANHVLFHSYSPDLSTNGTWSGFKAMTHFIFRILSSARALKKQFYI